MARLLRNLEDLSAGEEYVPDTFYCEALFLQYFVNDDMRNDFALITADFLAHEAQNIRQYELVHYLDMTRYEGDIDDLMERYVINLMMNAVKNGSQYARDLFLYLHKTYYKKEYRQLKRFHHISGEEFEAILRDSEWGISCIGVAHFATLCMLYGIELSPECNYSYELAGRFYERICGDEEQDDTTNLDDYLENVLDPCLEEVKERFGDVPALYKEYDKMGRFLSLSFRSNGLNEDCCLYGLDSEDYLYHTAYTLTLLKSAFPDRSFTNEEIILCGLAVQMQDALIEDVFSVRRFFGTVFEKQVSHVIAPLFDPAAVSRSPIQQDLPVDGKKRAVPDEKTNDSHSYKESALKEQIEELQQALHVKDGSIKTLRDQIKGLHDELRGYDQAKKEITALKDEVEAHNKELA
ncbi:MAG: hypothetical protein IK096_07885, partial [Lachnospiraceae bacterium]|nr:hypothetical protein [Lachnospiraceae bacterium]